MQHMLPLDPASTNALCFPFQVAYMSAAQSIKAMETERVLAVIRFDAESQPHVSDCRLWTVGLSKLTKDDTVEVWLSQSPVQSGSSQGVSFVFNEQVLLGYTWVEETCGNNLDTIAYATYQRLINVLRVAGYPHLLRAWNYFPDIHGACHGLERYQAFCRGRYRALTEALTDFEIRLPAASVIGTRVPGFLIYCLAAKKPGRQVENPRQTSAYRYPRQYGPRSPSFSRSILKPWGPHHHHLYISGTASIVGYQTRHLRDPAAQLRETLTNLTTLLKTANGHVMSPFQLVLLRVYVRRDSDVKLLRDITLDEMGPHVPIVFLEGALCRQELLVEVEGMALSSVERRADFEKF